ncbi:dTDP-4-dehydrorhamnose 3,5-epimerase [Prosthecochloris sp. GSB1]|uniref:dTDP-4-dehydrorhamnose 3,5-epimerase n=1 Tax=Prosthecochloris sp. GSB1 TaxID=281093 RepID=UPI000B8C72D6|nr:dTDP-4-dehydrorhamnose 3,5-epimerase [Prosthecochloris sp. GSB1]ASQ89964.1 dTDP-4-dehydrorhamnose 3,5-epimerase [Prosthecochloris sp. GSB1]
MDVRQTSLPEVIVFEPRVFRDGRGYFLESFRQDIFDRHVGRTCFVQDNESYSGYGVLRGLHYQKPPFSQGKLVRVVQGEVLDVAVDLRSGSPTFGRYAAQVLSGDNKLMMWVPRGFAHGFVVLSRTALFAYKCDNYYSAAHDAGVKWDDPSLGIDWRLPFGDIRVSEKDARLPKVTEIDPLSME